MDIMPFLSKHQKTIYLTALISLPAILFIFSDTILSKIFSILDKHLKKRKNKKRPTRIILIRHGESQANINPIIYDTIPDNKIELSENGKEQAINAGKRLKNIIKEESILFYVSPLRRTLQTFEGISQAFDKLSFIMKEDPRLREQEWGNFQNSSKINEIMQIRDKVGKFYFRFDSGESGSDVYDRVSLFLNSLFREFDSNNSLKMKKYDNIVIVTHGLFMRLFLMRFFKMSIGEFEKMKNPKNTEIVVLVKDDNGKYHLDLKMTDSGIISS